MGSGHKSHNKSTKIRSNAKMIDNNELYIARLSVSDQGHKSGDPRPTKLKTLKLKSTVNT